MNILVVCAAGMSSSALVSKMRTRIAGRNLENMKVGACSAAELDIYAIQADVIFLAPQLSFMEEKCRKFQAKVFVLDKNTYALQDADSAIDTILYGEQKKKETGLHRHSAELAYMHKAAAFIQTNPVFSTVSAGMTMVLPVTVCGALFSLAGSLPVPGYEEMIERTGLSALFSLGYDMTLGMISVYLIYAVSICAARRKHAKVSGPLLAGLISFFMFAVRASDGMIDLEYLSISGMFSALITGVVTSALFLWLEERLPKPKDIEGMPENVQASFLSLLPLLICVILSAASVMLVRLFGYTSPSELVEKALQNVITPLLGNSAVSYLTISSLASVLWFFGVHGGNITGALADPFYLSLSLENIRAYHAGQPLPNLINSGLSSAFYFGGVGSTLGLAFLCAYFAKSKRLRTVGKISLPMGIFFINEPLLFGLPVILNPQLFLPLVGVPLVSGGLTIFMMKAGILPFTAGFPIPWTTPPIISGLIQGGWRLALWQVFLLVLQTAMWYPFFLFIDRQEALNEKGDSQ